MLIRTVALVLAGLAVLPAVAQDVTVLQVKTQQIEGPECAKPPVWQNRSAPTPCGEEDLQSWLADAIHWRDEHRIRAGLDDSEYRRPELQWTQSDFVQPQMMVHDRFFYDPATQRYTVGRYLDDVTKRYGGIDSVLVWHTYPNMGIDDRSQYDLFQDLPGGVSAIKQFVREFHARGVKVLFPVMLWDQGTRAHGKSDAESIAEELRDVDADGVNGDTLDGVPATFQRVALATGHPLSLQPELGPAADEMLNWNTSSWGYWDYSFVPIISRFKWLEPRHQINISNRFAHDHTDDLQHALFNGVGFESWENIWGIWNGLTPRDAQALRRIATLERLCKDYLVSQQWRPFVPTRQFGVFASEWPNGVHGTLWTVINRNPYALSGRQLAVPHHPNVHYYDLWHGVEIKPAVENGQDVLSFELESQGFGAVLATAEAAPDLAPLKRLAEKPLATFSHEWASLPQQIVPIAATGIPKSPPAGMSHVPAADFVFRVNGVEIEGGDDAGLDVQYPGEPTARRYHEIPLRIPAFWIDTTPVTNAQFKQFMDATHYGPADSHNFLRDWRNGEYPAGWQDKPVTWVALEDARAYAKWAGKRLPHEWEWQYAAQGTDLRAYPWGNEPVAANTPAADSGRNMLPASGVHEHPGGASPFGVLDMVGNVWQWTDEWSDEHTRAAIIRGGSHYRPAGSRWYFPLTPKLSQHGKYLLMAPSLDRSGAIGFRCVMDSG